MKKHLTSVLTLVVICAVISVLMALTNYITAPIIKANDEAAANSALREVLPDGTGFKKIENFTETYEGIPKIVTEISAAENGGYAITLTVNGYGAGMKVMIGVNADGTIVGAKCLDKGGETKGEENTYGEKTLGAMLDTVDSLDVIAGATMTTNAYKSAAKAALQTAAILGGASLDTRTEEEILADRMKEALPTAEAFTRCFLTEEPDGVDAVYESTNGVGKVFLIGDSVVAVGTDGAALNGTEEEKALAEAAEALLAASVLTPLDLTPFADLRPFAPNMTGVEEVSKTASGNYVMLLRGAGFGIMNDNEYIESSGEYIKIKVALTPDGKIIDCLTVYQSETPTVGGICGTPAYYGQFAGKTADTYGEVDAIAGATFTTNGYLNALKQAFDALAILEGGDKS